MARIEVHLYGNPKCRSSKALIEDYSTRIKGRGISVKFHSEKGGASAYEKKISSLPGELIILDEKGDQYTSSDFAGMISKISLASKTVNFAIGPADGFSKNMKSQVISKISLSSLTMPHELASVILLEQLYRATEIMRDSPYHRE
ncbi:MAG: hypothetical protein CXT68_04710 [Methanobacteriota archaeon]|jgi:23S rRNA (pseudouridine1915-N3)-methyltransferase|nr:MAG: hypothetical protein CXT68_04710 [Euryarchaeota archaeon]